jgi:hypothetical protein
MCLIQCEELRSNHLTPLLVVTMPYACWFLWRAYYVEDFKWCLPFQFGVAFRRAILREVYFEGPFRIWRALKMTSILNTGVDANNVIMFAVEWIYTTHFFFVHTHTIEAACCGLNSSLLCKSCTHWWLMSPESWPNWLPRWLTACIL